MFNGYGMSAHPHVGCDQCGEEAKEREGFAYKILSEVEAFNAIFEGRKKSGASAMLDSFKAIGIVLCRK